MSSPPFLDEMSEAPYVASYNCASLHQLRLFDFGGGGHQRTAIRRFRVLEYLALVVADNDPIGVAAQDILRIHGHFAAAAARVYHILRHGVTSGVSAQLFHDLEALSDARPQVGCAGDQATLEEWER